MKNKFIVTLCAAGAFAFTSACADSSTNTNTAMNRTNAANTMSNTMSNANSMTNSSSNSSANSMANTMANSANPTVGGAPMLASQDIVENASNSKDHTTLVAAVKAAGLVDTLKGAGPFTVFAPTNAAFEKLPKGTVENLLKPESKATLTKVLTYHVVPGRQDAAAITKAITDGGGKATFKTVAGGTLTASAEGGSVVLTDEKGGKSKVAIADVMQSNGVIHVVDTVVMPN